MTLSPRTRRMMTLFGVAGLATAAITGCSSSSPSSSPSPSPSTPTSAAPTSTSGMCTSEAILAALPQGSEMVRFDCADVAGVEWAAAEVKPGPTVFFLQASGGTWDVSTSDEVCGTASAGLPPKLLDYCTSAGGSASPSESLTGSASPS